VTSARDAGSSWPASSAIDGMTRTMQQTYASWAVALAVMSSSSSSAAALASRPLWKDSASNQGKPLVTMPSLAPLVQRVEPAVLVVFSEGPVSDEGLPPGHPPIGPRLPPGHPPAPGPDDLQQGQGSGFLITPDGYALTNHHVVERAVRVWVSVGDDKDEIPCDVVGSDEKSDVAVLKLRSPRTDWPVLPLADSDAVHVGDVVVAIGSPFGLQQSVSMGIVSARGRRDIAPSGRQGLYDFLQTDASINPGNSGGPLLDASGAVVGINSAINAAGAGIGFAIPINQVKRMLPTLVEKGRYERSWIGVAIGPLSPAVAKGLGVPSPRGALVREVVPDGPGSKAGLIPGDVIVAFAGRVVHEASELPLMAGDAGVDAKVTLDVIRDGRPTTLALSLAPHPDNAAVSAPAKLPPPMTKDATIGVAVVTLESDQRSRLELAADVRGARISRLRPGSPAFLAGLAVDDVVIAVDGSPVADAETFARAVKASASGGILKVLVNRRGSTVFAAVEKP
jgi:serine protease Do